MDVSIPNFDIEKYRSFAQPDSIYNQAIFNATVKQARVLKAISLCKHRRIAIQAGGHTGIFAHYLSTQFNHVLSLEPCNNTIGYMRENLIGISNISKIKRALGDKKQKAQMVHHHNHAINFINFKQVGDIKVTTIDLIAKHPVDLICLSVRGAEYRVLKGGIKTITKYKPLIMVDNHGLMPEFQSNIHGSEDFRSWLCKAFNYELVHRRELYDVFKSRSL
jgi:FkbM family methyltransferase